MKNGLTNGSSSSCDGDGASANSQNDSEFQYFLLRLPKNDIKMAQGSP